MRTNGFSAFTPLEKITDSNLRSLLPKEESGLRLPLSLRGSLTAFTLPELLTVMVIIAILIGVLMPALSQVKRIAKETKQKAQIGSIDIAINLYKNDFGEYPPSHGYKPPPADPCYYNYCGAQTLAEAMLGQDLLGFHPDSIYRADGRDRDNTQLYNLPSTDPCLAANLAARKGPYLDRTNISVFDPCQIFGRNTSPALEPDKYAICDVFTAVSRDINGKKYKIGTPILYFRANPSAEYTELTPNPGGASYHSRNIYNYWDNVPLMVLKRITDGTDHPLFMNNGDKFYGFIGDPMILNLRRPVRPDSFILISAGNDGLYGTRDDICNFEPNLPG